eukprot:scaffold5718_cov20-Tisochrysis_lutea.AAC.1
MVGNNNGWHDKIEENKKKTGKSISSNIEELSTSAVIQDRHHAFQGQLHVMCCLSQVLLATIQIHTNLSHNFQTILSLGAHALMVPERCILAYLFWRACRQP